MTGLRIIRYAAWGAVALVVVALGAVAWQWHSGGGSERLAAASIGGPFTLTDQNGGTVTETALKGHPSAIFFGYTFCPDVCPTTLYEMSTYLQELGEDADKLNVAFVTVDPERDTPAKPRIPSGGKRVAATASAACSAVSTIGIRNVCTPASR